VHGGCARARRAATALRHAVPAPPTRRGHDARFWSSGTPTTLEPRVLSSGKLSPIALCASRFAVGNTGSTSLVARQRRHEENSACRSVRARLNVRNTTRSAHTCCVVAAHNSRVEPSMWMSAATPGTRCDVASAASGSVEAGRQALPQTHGYIHARAMYTGAEERGPLGLTLQTHTQAQVSAIRRVAARARGITAQRESPPHAHARSSAELLQRGWQMVGERRAATPRRAPLMRDVCAAKAVTSAQPTWRALARVPGRGRAAAPRAACEQQARL